MAPREYYARSEAASELLPVIPFERCIAKTSDDRPGMKVHQHCRIVGSVATAIARRLPKVMAGVLPRGYGSIAAIHDVGKVSPGFQKKIASDYVRQVAPSLAEQSNAQYEADHCKVGAAAIRSLLGSQLAPCPAAEIAGAHHGGCEGGLPRSDSGSKFGGKGWAAERRKLFDALISEFGEIGEVSPLHAAQSALAGMVTVADWIGSDEGFFAPEGLPEGVDLERLAAEALDECGWVALEMTAGLTFRDIFGFDPHPVQEAFIEVVTAPGLYVLEAPMGIGKTEAALYAAYRLMASGANQGLYFGLPTRLTSDKIHERVVPFLERICADDIRPRLAHGTAWLSAFEHGGEGLAPGSTWFNPRKRALLCPFGVGTIDQALLGVLRVKHHFVRMFGLAGKVVILDEVHSYDVYTGTLLDKLVEQLMALGCTVIVLSATLTGARRRRLLADTAVGRCEDAYPMVTAKKDGSVESVTPVAPPGHGYAVRLERWDADVVADAAAASAEGGNCVLCIANTVAKAQEWYDAVCATMTQGRFPVGLVHAKFPLFRREQIEEEWLRKLGKDTEGRPAGCVLVATQVVEQSVDIDADLLITELAPTDMLLQRMGRVWRHEREGRPCAEPEIVVVSGRPADAQTREELADALGRRSCFVYQPYVLWRTWSVWSPLSRVRLPDDIRDLIERTYAPSDEPELPPISDARELMEAFRDRLEKCAHAAEAGVKGLGIMADDERAATRYSDRPMVDVLLVRRIDTTGLAATLELLDEKDPVRVHASRRDFPVTARLHKQLVAVPKYSVEKLGKLETPLWLRKHFFGPTPVWEWEGASGELHMDGRPTGFAYDHTRGLRRLADLAAPSSRPYDDFDEMDVFDKTRFDW